MFESKDWENGKAREADWWHHQVGLDFDLPFVARVMDAVEELEDTGRLLEWEPPQALRYSPGQTFTPHVDTIEGYASRVWTAIVEVQAAPDAGFRLHEFPEVSITPGDLLIFDSSLVHEAVAPSAGTRYVLVLWASLVEEE
ncbi:MAG: 2OG-Fe(II) oxygenase [Chloroflexi bacterium]|nr:2OG-Fe(II) oxygenase [Chloroflexota bacterium]